jgi:hypothetical protein
MLNSWVKKIQLKNAWKGYFCKKGNDTKKADNGNTSKI